MNRSTRLDQPVHCTDDATAPDTRATTPTRGPTRPGREAISPARGAARRDPDALIEALASGQHGVVSRGQLLDAGIPVHVIDHRVRRRRLRPLHPGVYGLGPVRSPLEREMAAVLAGGDTAVVSCASAGVVWTMAPSDPTDAPGDIEISVRRGFRGRVAGVRVHRVPTLRQDEVTVFRDLPITTPARTLLDLAATLAVRALEQALARAERDRLATPGDVARLLEHHPWRPGVASLRALLGLEQGPALTRSEAEEIFLALIRRAKLPPPVVNARVLGMEVDFLWGREKLVVEIDGYEYHRFRRAFEGDHERDRALRTAGFHVVRFTFQQLVDEPDAVLADVVRELTLASVGPRR